MIRVRSVWARTLPIRPPTTPAAARSRLCVIAATASQAALALNTPEGICARAPFFSSDSVETILIDGGEERVVPEQVEQRVLPGSPFCFVEFRDASHHQTPRRLQCLLL